MKTVVKLKCSWEKFYDSSKVAELLQTSDLSDAEGMKFYYNFITNKNLLLFIYVSAAEYPLCRKDGGLF